MQLKSSDLAKSTTQTIIDRFSYLVDFIRKHHFENNRVSLLGKKANMGESSFYRFFKFELCITPNDFIVEKRLN